MNDDPWATQDQQKHLEFLREAGSGDDPAVCENVVKQAVMAWEAVWAASKGRMPVPAACTGPNGQMFCSWDRGRHHIELELASDEKPFWFWKDRETGEYHGKECEISDAVPASILNAINYFLEGE